jgi:hypothetical protein
MRVHKAWHNRAPSKINAISEGITLQDFSFSPNSEDDFIFANNRALLDHAEFTKLQPSLGTPRNGNQL